MLPTDVTSDTTPELSGLVEFDGEVPSVELLAIPSPLVPLGTGEGGDGTDLLSGPRRPDLPMPARSPAEPIGSRNRNLPATHLRLTTTRTKRMEVRPVWLGDSGAPGWRTPKRNKIRAPGLREHPRVRAVDPGAV